MRSHSSSQPRVLFACLAVMPMVFDNARAAEPLVLEPASSINAGERVFRISAAPDGKSVVFALNKGLVVWDLESGKKRFSLDDEISHTSIAFSPNGKLIAAAHVINKDRTARDSRIMVWEAKSGTVVRELDSPDVARVIAFSRASGLLASSCWDDAIRLWDLDSGKLVRAIDIPGGKRAALAYSADGKILATGGKDQVLRLWDAQQGKKVAELEGHKEEINTVAISPNGDVIATGGGSFEDETTELKLWSVSDKKEIATLSGHKYFVGGVAFSPDGKILASVGGDISVEKGEVI